MVWQPLRTGAAQAGRPRRAIAARRADTQRCAALDWERSLCCRLEGKRTSRERSKGSIASPSVEKCCVGHGAPVPRESAVAHAHWATLFPSLRACTDLSLGRGSRRLLNSTPPSTSAMSSKGATLLELKMRAKAREDEEKAKAARKRNMLVLVLDYLCKNGSAMQHS